MPDEPTTPGRAEDRRLAGRLLASGLLDPEELAAELTRSVGRYRVLRTLGRGASSEVLLAEDPALGRQVAIKLLTSSVAIAPGRFQREMRVLAALEHPNIVRILDTGALEDGRPFFVMELVGERTLDAERPPLRRWVEVLVDVARAAHFAHGQGVVHRDLKPSNILLGVRPVVADFGVAKLVGGEGPQLTKVGAIVGTPHYMAPEQVGAPGEVGPATDVYALGAILFEGLTGQPPFDGDHVLELMARIASEPPPSPRDLSPDVPAPLEAIALRALAKRPEDRFPSAEAFAAALDAWLQGRAGGRSRGRLLGAAVLVAVVALAGVIALLARSSDDPPTRAPAPPPPAVVPDAEPSKPVVRPVVSNQPAAVVTQTPDSVVVARARLAVAVADADLSVEALEAATHALQLDPEPARVALLLARFVRALGVEALASEATFRSRRDPSLSPAVRELRAALERASEARPKDGALALGRVGVWELDYWFTNQRVEDRNVAETHLAVALSLDPRGIDTAVHCALHALVRARAIREGLSGRAGREAPRLSQQMTETRRTCLADCEAQLARARALDPAHPELAMMASLLEAERAR